MKRITTWQQAFKVKGLDPKKMPDVSMIPAEYQKPLIAQYKLNVVAEVLNGDWKPDYTNIGLRSIATNGFALRRWGFRRTNFQLSTKAKSEN